MNTLRRPETPCNTEASPRTLVAIVACEKGVVSWGAQKARAAGEGVLFQTGLAESNQEQRALK